MSRNLLAFRIWLVLIVFAISLTGTSASAQNAAVVRVDPSALSAQVNDSVSLSIKVDNIANLTAFELHLSFNPNVLEVVQVTNGGFVAADFSAQNTFDNAAGTLDYAVAQLNRSPAQGNGTLLNIAFRAKTNGISTVALRATQAVPSGLLLSDQNGISIQASWAGGSVNVGTLTTITSIPITPKPITSTPITSTPITPKPITSTPITSTPITPTSIASTPVSPGGILGTHVVRSGEWIFCIGRAYGVSPWAIVETNGMWWPYFIFADQKLLIPNVSWTNMSSGQVCQSQFTASTSTSSPTTTATTIPILTTTNPATATPTPTATAVPSSACSAIYVVLPGDTLYNIAIQYNINYGEIVRVNQISNPRLIYSGQQLCIP